MLLQAVQEPCFLWGLCTDENLQVQSKGMLWPWDTRLCSFTPCLIVCCRFILQSAFSWCGRLCCRNVSVNIQYTFWACLSLSTTSTQTGLVEELFCFMSFSFESGPSVSYTLIMLTFYHTGQLCKQVWIRLSVKGRQNDVDGLGSHITVEDVFG